MDREIFTSKKLFFFIIGALMVACIWYLAVQPSLQQTNQELLQSTTGEVQIIVSVAKKTLSESRAPDKSSTDSTSMKTTITDTSTSQEQSASTTLEQPMTSTMEQSTKHVPLMLRDKPDNTGAKYFLAKYKKLFEKKNIVQPDMSENLLKPAPPASEADPRDPNNIRTWWQAAAMIDWYMSCPLRYKCKKRVKMGNWHICQDSPYTVSKPCLVYSFGIDYDYSFDDAMSNLGCEVHSFDPSMKSESHSLGNLSTFYKVGLSNVNSDAFVPNMDAYVRNPQVWNVRTLKTMISELGHSERVIDVIKMDIESYEWGVIDNMIETGVLKYVRQFLLEFHLFPKYPSKADYLYFYKTYTKLREMGFREFATSPHPRHVDFDMFNLQSDVEFVNVFFQHQ